MIIAIVAFVILLALGVGLIYVLATSPSDSKGGRAGKKGKKGPDRSDHGGNKAGGGTGSAGGQGPGTRIKSPGADRFVTNARPVQREGETTYAYQRRMDAWASKN